MTACERTEILLSALLDDELGHDETVEAVDHTLACASCADFWRGSRALDGTLELIGVKPAETPAPPDVWRRLAAPPRPRVAPGGWLALAAALLVLLGVAFFWPSEPTALVASADRAPAVPATVEVELGSRAGVMSEARFVELITELLEAEPRYQRAALQIMEEIDAMTTDREFTDDELTETETTSRERERV